MVSYMQIMRHELSQQLVLREKMVSMEVREEVLLYEQRILVGLEVWEELGVLEEDQSLEDWSGITSELLSPHILPQVLLLLVVVLQAMVEREVSEA